jgi:hypothetical protein
MSIVAYTGIKVRQMIYVIFFLLNLFFERERERERESYYIAQAGSPSSCFNLLIAGIIDTYHHA